jgi:hypothetical protein
MIGSYLSFCFVVFPVFLCGCAVIDASDSDEGDVSVQDVADEGEEPQSTDGATESQDTAGEGRPAPVLIQAECAVSSVSGDCGGAFSGGTSQSEPVWGQAPSYPYLDPSVESVVGFFNGGTWIRIDGVDMTLMNTVRMHLSNGAGAAGRFEIRLGAPDGMRIASVDSPVTATDDWSVFETVTQVLSGSFTGINGVYVIALNTDIGNGNLDWVEFSSDPTVEIDTDTGEEDTRIQAECALGVAVGDCNGKHTGDTSHSPAIWGGADDYPAQDPSNPGVVGYFSDGAWLRIDSIDMTGFIGVTVAVAGTYDDTRFYMYLDSPEGSPFAVVPVGNTGGWGLFVEVQAALSAAFNGVHDVYIVGESPDPEGAGVGNIDWFEFQ